jgi:hypothetical protein
MECCSTFKLCSCNLWHCCYQCYFVLHSYISQNNVAEECFSTSSTCLPSTTHTTQKNSPKKFSVKLLRTLVQRIVHPSCAAQPTQHKKIPLKFSTQTATTMYRSPEFARHNPKFPSKFLHSKLQVRIICPSSPGTTHATKKKSPQNFQFPKKIPLKILHSNCIVQVRAAQPHNTKKFPSKILVPVGTWRKGDRSRTGGRNKLKEIDGRETGGRSKLKEIDGVGYWNEQLFWR